MQRWPEPPLTASGLLYLFGEEFADPREGRLSGSRTRLIRSGKSVGSVSLTRSLFLTAFVSLAQQGYVSLTLERMQSWPTGHKDRVEVTKRRGEARLPISLEREIMHSIPGSRGKDLVSDVVGRVVSNKTRADAVRWTVGYVIDVLDEGGYLDWTLEPGLLQYEISRWADEDAVAPLAAEVQTLKDDMRGFELAHPYLYRKLIGEVRAGLGWTQRQEWLAQLVMEGIMEGIVEILVP
jgi:hypothetical protein